MYSTRGNQNRDRICCFITSNDYNFEGVGKFKYLGTTIVDAETTRYNILTNKELEELNGEPNIVRVIKTKRL